MAFQLQWRPASPEDVPDVTNLPPLDYALFLFNTVKFYFGFLSFMIDEELYLRDLHEFYKDPAAKAMSSRYWYTQYLLVLAFGKAFLTHRNVSGVPAGYQYAARAMALLPDLSGMHKDPLTCIQALSLAAVYFQSIDMRRAAFQHVSCLSEFMLASFLTILLRSGMRYADVSWKVSIGMCRKGLQGPNSLAGAGQSSG